MAQFWVVKQQAIEQSACPVACGRMHHQTRRFVNHNDSVVFVHHIQINVFGDKSRGFHARHDGDTDFFRTYQFVFRLRRHTIDDDQAIFNPSGDAAARVIGEQLC